jgi:hypothetical protein
MALNVSTLAKKLNVSESQFQEALSAIPFPVGQLLGCGNIGCTFAGSPGMVIKITGNESEVALWQQIVELEDKGADLSAGVPEVFGIGEIPSIGAYWVAREEVEPLVLGSDMKLSDRTKKYLLGSTKPSLTLEKDDWSFASMLERSLTRIQIPKRAWSRAEKLDEDLHKLYVLTDIEEFAERQPSIAEEVWLEAYIEAAMSTRGPLKGIGDVIATIFSETGDVWITDVHLGNVGWRLRGSKPQLLVYDWLTVEFTPNGEGVA